ncbi:MAG TPA: FecR family protein, partial [Methylophilaceae bacterium]
DEYAYEGKTDGQEKSFFSLVKGGLRAITGAVGHVNKTNYRINTPVATIGIRGTEFLASYDGKLLVKVGNGAVYMSNSGGDLTLFKGQSGEVKDQNSKPGYTNEQPAVTAAGPKGGTPSQGNQQNQQQQDDNHTFTVAEQTNSDGDPCVVAGGCTVTPGASATELPNVTLHNQNIALANYPDDSDALTGQSVGFNQGTVVVDSNGKIVSFGDDTSSISNFTGTVNEETTDGALSWARFTGGTFQVSQSTESGTVTDTVINHNTHLLYGTPTSAADINALTIAFANGGSYATYNLSGGTSPTDGAGHVGTLNSGTLQVAFTASPMVDATLNFTLAGANYNASGYGGITGSVFSLSGSASSTIGSASASGGDCAVGCNFGAVGFFAGAKAAQAGLSYLIQPSSSSNGDITGVAAFKRNGGFTSSPFSGSL